MHHGDCEIFLLAILVQARAKLIHHASVTVDYRKLIHTLHIKIKLTKCTERMGYGIT